MSRSIAEPCLTKPNRSAQGRRALLANFDDERKIPRGTKDIKDIYQDTSRPYLPRPCHERCSAHPACWESHHHVFEITTRTYTYLCLPGPESGSRELIVRCRLAATLHVAVSAGSCRWEALQEVPSAACSSMERRTRCRRR